MQRIVASGSGRDKKADGGGELRRGGEEGKGQAAIDVDAGSAAARARA
jgi:hypothetical protein